MTNNQFYKGTEVKFAINLTAVGFSMDDDDFEVEVATGKISIKGSKNGAKGDIVIFKDQEESSSGSSAWYVIANTAKLSKGEMKVIATAKVPDTEADDGVRTEVAVAILGELLIP